MATKYEIYKTIAEDCEARGFIRCNWGSMSYRGATYSVPQRVTVLNAEGLKAHRGTFERRLEEVRDEMAKGVYGSGAKIAKFTFFLEFIDKVLGGEYPPCRHEAPVEPEVPVEPEKPAEPVQKPAETTNDAMNVLASVVAEVVAKSAGADVVKAVSEKAIQAVREFVQQEYGPIQKKVEIITPTGKVKPVEGMVHEAFDEVLAYVQADEPVFLVGPAGCGKNVLCKQVAEALDLEFYFSNAVSQEYKITGFTDAMGIYQESQFYKAFTQGGLFFLDEMDASIPEVLLILNSAIANRYFDFPAPIGRVQAHPDFRVVSAGNTVGQGASFEYVGRNQLDASSLDRFAVVRVGYDPKVELAVAGGDSELVDFIHDIRRVCAEKGIQMIASYRSIGRIAKMSQSIPLPKVLDSCLIKGMDKADLDMVVKGLKDGNRYAQALRSL